MPHDLQISHFLAFLVVGLVCVCVLWIHTKAVLLNQKVQMLTQNSDLQHFRGGGSLCF